MALRTRLPGLFAVLLPLALAFAALAEPAIDQAARQKLLESPDGLLEHRISKYNDISIHKKRNEVTMSFHVKGWHYTESRTNLRDPAELPLIYARTMTTALVYPDKLESILMIGLGGGSISTYFNHYLPATRIDAVDIDPAVIELAKKYFGIRETKDVRYIAADGRAFVKDATDKYDLVLLDAYDGGNVPSQLMTREFYELVKGRLNPGGAVAANLHNDTKFFESSILTMQAVFGAVELFATGRGETIAIARNGEMPDAAALKKRAEELAAKYPFKYSPVYLLSQKKKPSPRLRGEVLTDAQAPVHERP